jgi:hypothetical protein
LDNPLNPDATSSELTAYLDNKPHAHHHHHHHHLPIFITHQTPPSPGLALLCTDLNYIAGPCAAKVPHLVPEIQITSTFTSCSSSVYKALPPSHICGLVSGLELDQTVPSLAARSQPSTFGSAFWRLADIQQSASLSSFFLLDNVGEQKCRAILDLDTTEDMELHHHHSNLRITAHLHHKRVDMAMHNLHLHSNRTATPSHPRSNTADITACLPINLNMEGQV